MIKPKNQGLLYDSSNEVDIKNTKITKLNLSQKQDIKTWSIYSLGENKKTKKQILEILKDIEDKYEKAGD